MSTTVEEVAAGKGLDVLVAERVMEWRYNLLGDAYEYAGGWRAARDFRPSEDIAAAFEVVAAVRKMMFSRRLAFKKALIAQINDRLGVSGRLSIADDEIIFRVTPEDICRAALKATRATKQEVG